MLTLPEGDFAGYIFDLDGTLADSMPLHYAAWREAFLRNNAKFDFTWAIFYSMAGIGHADSVRILNDRFQDTLEPEAVLAVQSEHFTAHFHTMQPIEPLVELARKFAQTHPISIASGGERHHVHETLRIIGIDELFSIVVSKDDVANSKPAPDSFLLAAEKMGVEPQKCLVFEDSQNGIQAADAAGMQSVYVDPAVYSSGPDAQTGS